MSTQVKRALVLKVTGVASRSVPKLYELYFSSDIDEALRPRVLNTKKEEQGDTYLVELSIPIEGLHYVNSRYVPWKLGSSFAQQVFDILGIFHQSPIVDTKSPDEKNEVSRGKIVGTVS